MNNEIPDKDIRVAVTLLEKLDTARDEQSKLKRNNETVSDEYEELRRTKEARTNYIGVLSEVAQAVGEEVEYQRWSWSN